MFGREHAISSETARSIGFEREQERVLQQEAEGGVVPYLNKEFSDAIWSEQIDAVPYRHDTKAQDTVLGIILGESQRLNKSDVNEAKSLLRKSRIGRFADKVRGKEIGAHSGDISSFLQIEQLAGYAVLSGEHQLQRETSEFIGEFLRVAGEDQLKILNTADPADPRFREALDRTADLAAQYRILFGDQEPFVPQEEYAVLKLRIRTELEKEIGTKKDLKLTQDGQRMIQSHYDPRLLAWYRVLNANRLNFTPQGMEIIDRLPGAITKETFGAEKTKKEKYINAYYASEQDPPDGLVNY